MFYCYATLLLDCYSIVDTVFQWHRLQYWVCLEDPFFLAQLKLSNYWISEKDFGAVMRWALL